MTQALLPQDRALLITHAERLLVERELEQLRVAQHQNDPYGGGLPDPLDPAMTLHERIVQLEHDLARATTAHGFDVAAVGTTVEVHDGRRECRYTLTLGAQHDRRTDAVTVSATSPVGRALMGRAVGDDVPVALPDGRTRQLRVLGIRDAS